jgi:DNA-binding NarL/FixJ family response regulator
VQWYISTILSKLGANSRREAATLAVAAGVV